MKKTICIISVLIVIISAFCACNKTDTKQTAEKATKSTTVSTTAFTVGSEAATSAVKYENEKQVYHKDNEGNDLLLEKFNSDDELESYEEPVYKNDGSVDKINYYDADKKLVASSDNCNHFYDKDGKEITENDFVILMKEANILK